MTRRLHKIRRHACRTAKAVLDFAGPVADGVKGQISTDEWKRVATKTLAAWITANVTLHAAAKDPEVWQSVIIPLVWGATVGLSDALMHRQSGQDKPPPPPSESPPTP